MRERKIIRLKGYDYSTDNFYFVTSCVKDRVRCFGDVVSGDGNGRVAGMGRENVGTGRNIVGTGRDPSLQSNGKYMKLNEYGKIAEKQWFWLREQYPYIVLHAFVVMPNHIHGIIEINRDILVTGRNDVVTGRDDVVTGRDPSQLKIKSLSELIGAYKTTVSKKIHVAGLKEFAWQRSFYEHIIRDDKSLQIISTYIIKNPTKWNEDKFNGNY